MILRITLDLLTVALFACLVAHPGARQDAGLRGFGEPIDPAGTWSVYHGTDVMYRLVIERDGDHWNTRWLNRSLDQWRGTLTYTDGRWVERWRQDGAAKDDPHEIEWIWGQRGAVAPQWHYRVE